MVVKIILCIIVGTLFMIMLSLYREVHRKNNYPAAVFVEGEMKCYTKVVTGVANEI